MEMEMEKSAYATHLPKALYYVPNISMGRAKHTGEFAIEMTPPITIKNIT